jgi:hypothetical protein
MAKVELRILNYCRKMLLAGKNSSLPTLPKRDVGNLGDVDRPEESKDGPRVCHVPAG